MADKQSTSVVGFANVFFCCCCCVHQSQNSNVRVLFLLVLWGNSDEEDDRDLEKLEEKIWDPNSSLTEKQIDQFLVVAR